MPCRRVSRGPRLARPRSAPSWSGRPTERTGRRHTDSTWAAGKTPDPVPDPATDSGSVGGRAAVTVAPITSAARPAWRAGTPPFADPCQRRGLWGQALSSADVRRPPGCCQPLMYPGQCPLPMPLFLSTLCSSAFDSIVSSPIATRAGPEVGPLLDIARLRPFGGFRFLMPHHRTARSAAPRAPKAFYLAGPMQIDI